MISQPRTFRAFIGRTYSAKKSPCSLIADTGVKT
jgi:hypothetical protein